jgi:hypothetical protein
LRRRPGRAARRGLRKAPSLDWDHSGAIGAPSRRRGRRSGRIPTQDRPSPRRALARRLQHEKAGYVTHPRGIRLGGANNFQWAWSSSTVAGRAAGRAVGEAAP